MCKQMIYGSFKKQIYELYKWYIFKIYMYKENLVSNNPLALSARTAKSTDCFSAGGKTPPQWVSWTAVKQSVMLELWRMLRSTLLLPFLPGPLWPGVVAPDRDPSMGQNGVLMLNITAWNRTVSSFKMRSYAKLNCLK